MSEGSLSFDRAAGFYDATRTLGDETIRRDTELLVGELRSRSRVLEVGVGTGQVALRLHDAGIPMVGLDLSAQMLAKLAEKREGGAPFPLVRADAVTLPFRSGAFDGAVMRHVLHLVPGWRRAVRDVVRVVGSGGVVLVDHGGPSAAGREVRARVEEIVGRALPFVGLPPERWRELRAEMRRTGARHRMLEAISDRRHEPLSMHVAGIAEGRWAWTWQMTGRERVDAASSLAAWLEAPFGPLDAPVEHEQTITWHAYDLR
jgi:ubiquinone/menaquinone biosynthesis C-methylase UbiE